jgi:hypothetical protein
LLELFVFLILPVLIDVLLVKVILVRRYEWCDQLPLPEILPGKVLKPGVHLNLRRPILSEAIHRFPLDHLTDNSNGMLTLLMKSAASRDQPFGTSPFFI